MHTNLDLDVDHLDPQSSPESWMQMAIDLARRGVGQTGPNPSVGCVIVKNNQMVGFGHTAQGGRPHAETIALQMAGKEAAGADMFVTLEPCCHHGKTPPCIDAIIASGVQRVYIACTDPDPRVNGQGIKILESKGVMVEKGFLEQNAQKIIAGHVMRVTQRRPWVTLKLAMSLDGKIAPVQRQRPNLSNPQTRMFGHRLRSQNDAVMVGIGTILADDPLLTCRLPGYDGKQPVRIVYDPRASLPDSCQLLQTTEQGPVWVLVAGQKITAFPNIRMIHRDRPDDLLLHGLQQMAQWGVTRLLCEGGRGLASQLLLGGWVDEWVIFRVPVVIGDGGLSAFDILPEHDLYRFELTDLHRMDDNIVEFYQCV